MFEEERSRSWLWILIVAAILLFFGFSTYSRNKAERERRKKIELMRVGDEVIIASGLCGKLVKKGEDFFVIEIAPGVRVKVLKDFVLDRKEAVLFQLRQKGR